METLYGKDRPLARLAAFRRSGRFPHALMFRGEKGVGRGALADYTAALLLCERGGEAPCGECIACRKVAARIHPDVIYPLNAEEKGRYTVERLRGLIADCYKRPNDGELRICIFEDIDEMSELCQNTLLKFIEEPLVFNRCLFTAEKSSAILETVHSRVTEIDVEPAGHEACLTALAAKGIGRERAEELFGLYGGNIGKCLDGEKDENAAALLKTVAEIAEALYMGREYDCAARFAAFKSRDELGAALGCLSELFAAAAVALSGGSSDGGALSGQVKKLAAKLKLSTADALYAASTRLASALEFNPNVSLFAAHCCETLFTVLEEGI
ncbi:MAG: hypothetical protein NC084_08200 [Bacteroides sp.]|nr:hypothetical protein [Eubacterium sp.]MCM1418623.1 hypothetical protein [Roseburia sp.]MCM1462677.1 hypothetical protein [Bacteroides sp.]